MLDLAANPPVARRFGLGEDELERMAQLVAGSGVRWGLDAQHRRRFGLDSFGQNTWAAGLDRILLGVAMDSEGDRFIKTALPLDDVDSGDVELVGRIAELLSRLTSFCRRVGGFGAAPERHSLDWWLATCREALDSLTSVPRSESWQNAHAYGELARLAEEGGAGEADDEPVGETGGPGDGIGQLSLADLRALLADAFRGRATRANFRTGTLTMCTMLPMRSVPHRVICLLGVDDATFPRHRVADGDDIVALEPWIGDRDPRSEDRQLLLDALMATEERLVVVYSGIDARTGAEKPVSVPIGELLDALDETAGRSVRELVSVRHTLQPFDRANFIEDDPVEDVTAQNVAAQNVVPARVRARPRSFDRTALRGARAAGAERRAPVDVFDVAQLPRSVPDTQVALADLTRFFTNPAKALLRGRAQLYLRDADESADEQIPIAPDGLDGWAIGDRLLQRRLVGLPADQLAGAEWRRGHLPPKALGQATLDPILGRVEELVALAEPFLIGDTNPQDLEAQLAGGDAGPRTVTGTIPNVYGERIVTVTYSWLGAKQRLQAWIQLLALTVTSPGTAWQAVTIGRGRRSLLGPIDERFARAALGDLLTLYDTGQDEPLPFAPATSAEYARIRFEDKSVTTLAARIQHEWCVPKQRSERDADFARFASTYPESVDALLAPRATADDVRGTMGEPSRFGSIARRVWQPLLMREELRETGR